MDKLQVFNNKDFGDVRMLEVEGRPYAIGIDVARILGYARPADAITAHCKGSVSYRVLSGGGEQDTKIIPEGDIYRLIFKAADQSKNEEIKAKAEEFGSWVFDEVLPAIRKTGKYELPQDKQIKLLTGQVRQYRELAEAYSEQIASGFPEHRTDYLTEKEAAKLFKLNQNLFKAELVYGGYLEHQIYGRKSKFVLRLSDRGKEFGEEILSTKSGQQPFAFRWKRKLLERFIRTWKENGWWGLGNGD